jgi:signal transduction histidine kinase
VLDALHTGGILREEQRTIHTRDGMRRVISLSAATAASTAVPAAAATAATASLDGELRQGLVVVARDVTAREEMEAFQRELVATFSHDLRAPLTNINVLVDMLAGAGAESGQVNFEYLNSLRAQSRRLTDLVERTLDLSRMDAGQWTLEPRPVPLSRLLEEAVGMWREAARDRRLCLDLPPASLWVWADERAVVTALGNLIDNALKYSTPDTEVRVSATSTGGEVVIAVHNHGPAIAPEHQTRLFERFYRVDRGDSHHGDSHHGDSRRVYGFGLGLYIARKLVERMGGRIWVVSEPANGTRFAFTAPLVKEDQLETADH